MFTYLLNQYCVNSLDFLYSENADHSLPGGLSSAILHELLFLRGAHPICEELGLFTVDQMVQQFTLVLFLISEFLDFN